MGPSMAELVVVLVQDKAAPVEWWAGLVTPPPPTVADVLGRLEDHRRRLAQAEAGRSGK